MRTIRFGAAVGLALVCASCDRGAPVRLVAGSVMCKGSPAEGAVVLFRGHGSDAEKDPPILSVVRADGTFDLAAPAGEYDVFVEWTRRPATGKSRVQTGRDLLGGRYADRKAPRLHASVKPGADPLPPFDVTK
jgi:hypothetical protein